jgi:hypothetical protein
MKSEIIENLSKEIRVLSSNEVEAEKAVFLLERSIMVFDMDSNKDALVEYVKRNLDEHRKGVTWYAEHFVLAGESFLKYVSYGKNI